MAMLTMTAVAPGFTTPYSFSTAASSRTVIEVHVRTALDEELERDESHMEKYGGDDPEDPPSLSPSHLSVTQEGISPSLSRKGKGVDINLVGWNGPDDPENPQNWSKGYKWFVTILCSILTLNV